MSHHHYHEGQGADSHGHTHGAVDPSILATQRGIWAVKWSFAGLFLTALLQIVVVWLTGSVALLADTIHNFGDASTAIPLWIAFRFAQMVPNKRFTYGYGRVEDLAGVFIVLVILFSALFAGYQAIDRLLNPRAVQYVAALAAAGVVGFIGNEAVALFRLKVGKQIGSAALVADGYHARVDGLTSLAVALGALAVWLGLGWADPTIALLITVMILRIVWQSAKLVFGRLLDKVDADSLDEIAHSAGHVAGVVGVHDTHARWSGHQLYTELSISVLPSLTIEQAHQVARDVQHQMSHHLPHLGHVMIHVDPSTAEGSHHHPMGSHQHDGLPVHSHVLT